MIQADLQFKLINGSGQLRIQVYLGYILTMVQVDQKSLKRLELMFMKKAKL